MFEKNWNVNSLNNQNRNVDVEPLIPIDFACVEKWQADVELLIWLNHWPQTVDLANKHERTNCGYNGQIHAFNQ